MSWDLSKKHSRILILGVTFFLFYIILIFRLWHEQIYQGKEYREKISRQSIRCIRLPALRGRIFTSDMHILADNAPSHDIVFHPAEMRQPGKREKTIEHILKSAQKLAAVIGRRNTVTEEEIIRHINLRPALPMTIFENLSIKEMANASELSSPIQGMELATIPVRYYPEGKAACHILGYVGQDDPRQAQDRSDYFYYIPDQKGVSGVEKEFDTSVNGGTAPLRGLRGIAGNSLVRVDSRGYIYETIGIPIPPQDGNDIVLTIDWKAQEIVEKLLAEKKGAFVLLNAMTGAVLAMSSSPGYDLQTFKSELGKIKSDKNLPFFNRVTLGEYTPGSSLKPLIALALLKNGLNPDDKILCEGAVNIGSGKIRCPSWKTGGHGYVNLPDAITRSCNVYFVERGQQIGLEKIAETLHSAGIGAKTGICLPERPGVLPSREEKFRRYKEKWNKYDTSLLSIGQGIILMTPLQAAVYAAAIANDGILWNPYILKEVRNPQGNTLYEKKICKRGNLNIKPQYLKIVRKGMYMVVHGEEGTGKRAFSQKIKLYGKTGTAEVGPLSNRKLNSWFLGFGERNGNLYAFSILIEEGISGGYTCAPLAKQFFDEWIE